jgi:hypothetical protein
MASLSVVDQSHFGVGLRWWLLSGLFARHAEFAWHELHHQVRHYLGFTYGKHDVV